MYEIAVFFQLFHKLYSFSLPATEKNEKEKKRQGKRKQAKPQVLVLFHLQSYLGTSFCLLT